MKYFDLDKEEEKLLKDFENGKFKPVKDVKSEIARFKKIAGETLAKKANINLRLSQKVILKLKAKAAAFGIPYQTMAGSVLHRFALSQQI